MLALVLHVRINASADINTIPLGDWLKDSAIILLCKEVQKVLLAEAPWPVAARVHTIYVSWTDSLSYAAMSSQRPITLRPSLLLGCLIERRGDHEPRRTISCLRALGTRKRT